MNINEILDEIYLLPEASKEKLKQSIIEVNFPRGYLLLKADKVKSSI